ncbi:Plexin-A4 [Manis pentadactyla]|nr:Plexin-A4 [Manis pentadactyla]
MGEDDVGRAGLATGCPSHPLPSGDQGATWRNFDLDFGVRLCDKPAELQVRESFSLAECQWTKVGCVLFISNPENVSSEPGTSPFKEPEFHAATLEHSA